MEIEPISDDIVEPVVRRALEEDRAFEDATSLAVVEPGLMGTAKFLAKSDGVAAGFSAARLAFALIEFRFGEIFRGWERLRRPSRS